jgi:hypothetical protein
MQKKKPVEAVKTAKLELNGNTFELGYDFNQIVAAERALEVFVETVRDFMQANAGTEIAA